MPLYEYQCKKCKHKFEKIQKFSDQPVKKCPECGSPVEKIMHAPAVQFKGSGWYVTDYGGKSEAPKSDGGSEKSDKSEKKDTGKEDGAKGKDKDSKSKKSEAKSEGKSESKSESRSESKKTKSSKD